MSRLLALIVALATWAVSPLLLAQGAVPAVTAAPETPAPGGPRGNVVTRPTWKELKPAQREALAPLASHWDTLDRDRKEKWLDVAAKYPRMSPDGQRRLHERMTEFARLTPEQRNTARENFKKAYELPADQRQSLIQQYQELSPERKQELANQAAARKAEPPRRATRDLKGSDPKAAK